MTSVTSLGIPGLSGQSAGLAPRRKTRQLKLGKVGVGSDHPMSVQSMTTTRTHDVNATLQHAARALARVVRRADGLRV